MNEIKTNNLNAKKSHIRSSSLQLFKSSKEGFVSTNGLSNRININSNEEKDKVVSCLICFDKLPNSVIMECGHGGFILKLLNKLIIKKNLKGICYDCSLESWKNGGECFLCRNVNFFF